jgi:phosphoglycolate phosphatase
MPSSSALVFDLDGTLVDTASDILAALNVVLLCEHRKPVGRADIAWLVGHGARPMLAAAFARTGAALPPTRIEGLTDDFLAHYRDHIADESRTYPGVEETLGLFVRGGARLGVLTNKPQVLAELLLEKLGLAHLFAAIHGAGRYPYAKPDARVFHHVVAEMGGAGAGAIMIGDSATDVATARAARVPVVLVAHGYTPVPASELGADAVAEDFRALPGIVARILDRCLPAL